MRPLVVSIEMGYGHLRAARAVADLLGAPVHHADRPPLAPESEARAWRRVRLGYELLSRSSQLPFAGGPLRRLLEGVTAIEDAYPRRDQSRPTLAVLLLERLARGGLGAGLLARLDAGDATLVTSFYAPAVIAGASPRPPAAGPRRRRVVAIVTDSDVNRIWVPRRGADASIEYCAPSERAARRLVAYGAPAGRVHVTGFPLPPELLGGPDLPVVRRNLAARLVRLDPRSGFRGPAREELEHFLGPLPAAEEGRPPHLVFAVGGAGAQAGLANAFLPSLARPLREGALRLTLVAGTRRDVAGLFAALLAEHGLDATPGVAILGAPDFDTYYDRFNALLAGADILWTKPSELTFYAALGLPLVFARPVGVHERANRKWARQRGAGLKQENPRHAWDWLREWLKDGTLAGAAWSGYTRLPKFGVYKVRELVETVAGVDA